MNSGMRLLKTAAFISSKSNDENYISIIMLMGILQNKRRYLQDMKLCCCSSSPLKWKVRTGLPAHSQRCEPALTFYLSASLTCRPPTLFMITDTDSINQFENKPSDSEDAFHCLSYLPSDLWLSNIDVQDYPRPLGIPHGINVYPSNPHRTTRP